MKELKPIIKQICAEKGISEESVYETINSALAAAYRKDFGEKNQNIVAEFNPDTGATLIFDEKEVVKNLTKKEIEAIEKLRLDREARREALERGEIVPERTEEQKEAEEAIRKFNPRTEIELKQAKRIDPEKAVGDIIRTELKIPGDFGRMAAQTAKQVIIQRLREAERNVIYQTYKEREGEVVNGTVQKREGRNILIDLEPNVTGLMPASEQIRFERYNVGDRIKVLITSVSLTTRGPEIIVSRAHADFIRNLFASEIPEIASGVIEIKGIAREAGGRSKVAVYTEDSNIDPIGSCIGQRGARIQTIIAELNGEKVDIIEYSDDPEKFITNALLPAKISSVELLEEEKIALITVPADQLSLTIGREGQNVRLAVKLTGWKINIKEEESGKEISNLVPNNSEQETTKEDTEEEITTEETETEATQKVKEAKEKPEEKKVTKKKEATTETTQKTKKAVKGKTVEKKDEK